MKQKLFHCVAKEDDFECIFENDPKKIETDLIYGNKGSWIENLLDLGDTFKCKVKVPNL